MDCRRTRPGLPIAIFSSFSQLVSSLVDSFFLFHPLLFARAMSSQQGQSTSPPPPAASSAANSGVRRHHTISASSRNSRPTSKVAVADVEDTQAEQHWNDDEVVDQDWVGGIGAVGEKSSLHRQASLPTRYHRGTAFFGHGTSVSMLKSDLGQRSVGRPTGKLPMHRAP